MFSEDLPAFCFLATHERQQKNGKSLLVASVHHDAMNDTTPINPTALQFCVPIDILYCRYEVCATTLYYVWRVLCSVLGCHLRAGGGATWKSLGKENGRSQDYQRCVRFLLPFLRPSIHLKSEG
jgi:hypothetical protein